LSNMSLEELVLEKFRELPPDKQKRLLEYLQTLQADQRPGKALNSLAGLWANDGIDVTEEDIAEARREMWGNFPRDIS